MIVVAAGAVGLVWVNGSAAAEKPTVAQIKAAIAKHSDDFVLANAYAYGGQAPGHGWIDVKTGAGRWVSANAKRVTLVSVRPAAHDPMRVVVTDTSINYATRTWSRAKHEERATRPHIVDPLTATSRGVRFNLLGVESVDGQETYHLRSSYFPYSGSVAARADVWFSTNEDYLIRYTRSTRGGKLISRVDNRWLPRTAANLALLTARVPNGFRRVFSSP
jgi:hypothetical protein